MSNGSIYPDGVDNFGTVLNDVDYVEAKHVNQLNSAINKIETELGTSPSGEYSDVKTRLNNMELGDLVNVVISNPSDNEIVSYASSSSKWENRELSADNISDGEDKVIITPTQEANFETAYTHSQITTGNPHDVTAGQASAIADSSDTVKDSHIDWGTGANQVSLDDVPDGSTSKLGQDCSANGTPQFSQVGVGKSPGTNILLHIEPESGDTPLKIEKSSGGTWWNSSWDYKTQVTINNGSGGTLSNYQAKVELDTATLISAGKMKSDCSDIRVLNSAQDTELDFWVDPTTVNTASTDIWVEVLSLPTGDTTIYIYYSNASASSTSNGSDTFEFFDDFESYSTGNLSGQGGWADVKGTTQVIVESGSKMIKIIQNDLPKHSCTFGSSDRSMVARVKAQSATEQITFAMFDGNAATGNGYNEYLNGYDFLYYGWTNQFHRISRGAGNSNTWLTDQVAGIASSGNYYVLESRWYGNNLKGLVDGVEKLSAQDSEYSSRDYLGIASWGSGQWYVDHIFVRKFTATEPTASIGSEYYRVSVKMEIDEDGNITEGTWQGSPVEVEYGGTGLARKTFGPDMQNLSMVLNSTNPDYQVDVEFDYLQVEDYNLSSSSFTIDITQSGADGLDTGSESADTWYSIWTIYNPVSDSSAGLFSTSIDSPTLPSGYTKKRSVGWVRNGSSSSFINPPTSLADHYHWRGDPSSYDKDESNFASTSSWTELDFSDTAPPGVRAMDVYCSITASDSGSYLLFRRKGQTNDKVRAAIGVSVADIAHYENFTIPCDDDRKVEYYRSDDITDIDMVINGWWM